MKAMYEFFDGPSMLTIDISGDDRDDAYDMDDNMVVPSNTADDLVPYSSREDRPDYGKEYATTEQLKSSMELVPYIPSP